MSAVTRPISCPPKDRVMSAGCTEQITADRCEHSVERLGDTFLALLLLYYLAVNLVMMPDRAQVFAMLLRLFSQRRIPVVGLAPTN